MSSSAAALLILGDQLFSQDVLKAFKGFRVFMAEDYELCTHERYHKKKILLFLSAMRHFRESHRSFFKIHYEELQSKASDTLSYEERLENFIKSQKIQELHVFEIEDKFFEKRIQDLCERLRVSLVTHSNPSFLCPRAEFEKYLASVKKPFMKTFYERERKRLKVLVDAKLKPLGGQWSFDEDNRRPYRGEVELPRPIWPKLDAITQDLQVYVEREFASHPGSTENFRYPVTHTSARAWLDDFLLHRLEHFGSYEDAIVSDENLLFHSLLSPLLNTGLLTPFEVMSRTMDYARQKKVTLNSLEGFVRQVMGWREFVRGIYRRYSETQESSNFFEHHRRLKEAWYMGTTGLPPLDAVIRRVNEWGYCHHIERLMVLSNLMLLCEVHPREVHRWFMEMFVDSADWVMGPNVYGMGQFADGGIFATKPYICASNYILKMSDHKKGEWCDVVDGLYWRFIEKHEKFFMSNPRLSMMPRSLKKMDPKRLQKIKASAEGFLSEVTY
jgi:deoxyribodipyrimidine photolyase-related protein